MPAAPTIAAMPGLPPTLLLRGARRPSRRRRAACAMIDAVCALASSLRSLHRWPPAMWPVSCASTPMIWFGVGDSISAPALTKMRRPSTTKALKRAVVDDDDLDVLLGEAGGAQDRLGVVAQQLLDLGVADDRQAAAGFALGARRCPPAAADGQGRDRGDRAECRGLCRRLTGRAVCYHSNLSSRSSAARRTTSGRDRSGQHDRARRAPIDQAAKCGNSGARAPDRRGERDARSGKRRSASPRARSDVPPFMVMDVMAAAARLEAPAGHVIHMESRPAGAPAPRRPRSRPRGRRSSGSGSAIPRASGAPPARAHRAALSRDLRGRSSIPSASSSPPARRPASSSPSSPLFEPGDRVALAAPGYPPIATSCTALGCEPVADRDHGDDALRATREALLAAHRADAARGRADREPGQSDRHHDDRGGARRR